MNLQELSVQELKSTNGGAWWTPILTAFIVGTIMNYDDAADALVEGWNAYEH